MNSDQLIYKKLSELSVSPPDKVWQRIERSLMDNDKLIPFYYSTEKKAIAACAIAALVIFGVLINYIKSIDRPIATNIEYTQPFAVQPSILLDDLVKKNEAPKKNLSSLTPKNAFSHSKKLQTNIILSRSNNPIVKLNKEEIVLINEIIAIENKLIKETKQLVKLNTEISRLSQENHEFTLASNNNYNNVKVADFQTEIVEVSKPISIFDYKGIYLTPFIGGNFTQVYYQSKPIHPYFSDKAVFTGKIGYTAGFQLGYQLNRYFSIETGIGYGQYIQSFRETIANQERKGEMYINQLDIPLMGRYSIHFGNDEYPKSFSFKTGLMYNSVTQYQLNYTDRDLVTKNEKRYNIEADKRLYNSLQLGYIFGFDFDSYISRKVSLNISMLNSLVSQVENFPMFKNEQYRPIQFTTTFSIGTKIRF